MEIDEYIARVRTQLAAPSPDAAETLDELRAHLEDAMGDLQLSGLDPDASAREAVRRCGPPAEIARAMLHTRGLPQRRPQPSRRSLAAALLVAIAVAAVGGSAVASASVSSGGAGRHVAPLSSSGYGQISVVPSHLSAPSGHTSLVAPRQTSGVGR